MNYNSLVAAEIFIKIKIQLERRAGKYEKMKHWRNLLKKKERKLLMMRRRKVFEFVADILLIYLLYSTTEG